MYSNSRAARIRKPKSKVVSKRCGEHHLGTFRHPDLLALGGSGEASGAMVALSSRPVSPERPVTPAPYGPAWDLVAGPPPFDALFASWDLDHDKIVTFDELKKVLSKRAS